MINLSLNKEQKKNLFNQSFLGLLIFVLALEFLSFLLMNFKNKIKDYQKFAIFSSCLKLDDKKLSEYINSKDFDGIFDSRLYRYDVNESYFEQYMSTSGAYDSDIYVLGKSVIDSHENYFVYLPNCISEGSFEYYNNIAIKVYDGISKEGYFSDFVDHSYEEDLYFAINVNSYHYKTSKKNSTNYAVEFIQGLK